MLAADRSAVETDLQAQAVQIKNIEMNNIDRYLQAIGTQAALICGFAASESWAMEKWNTQVRQGVRGENWVGGSPNSERATVTHVERTCKRNKNLTPIHHARCPPLLHPALSLVVNYLLLHD